MIWDLRECVAPASVKRGLTVKYDVSMPAKNYYNIIEEITSKIHSAEGWTEEERHSVQIMGYGQIGDGNIHIKISVPGHESNDLKERVHGLIDPFVTEYCKNVGGSITAKLGVGQCWPNHVDY